MFKILASVIFDDILNIKKEAETIAYCLLPIPYPHQKTFCCKPYVYNLDSPHQNIPKTKSTQHTNVKWTYKKLLVDPSRVELLSRLGIDFSLIHRFSPFYPRDGERSLSRTLGCSGEVFAN